MVLDTGRGQQRALDDLVATAHQIGTAVESVIDGKAEAVRLAIIVLLAEGHLLIEDVPGEGHVVRHPRTSPAPPPHAPADGPRLEGALLIPWS